jgi:ribonuclease D
VTDAAAEEPPGVERPAAVPLLHPAEGVPPVITSRAELREIADRFAAGTGPVAVDAERASGYRYGQRAYLVQARRAGAGTTLIDPIAVPDLSPLAEAVADAEWVLHAASQDLPSLTEVGMRPRLIFDTELAGRLAGFERVGLGTMVETVLGLALEKEHSAVDWSRRPLPEPWLRYAALDVEVLVELRDALEADLRRQGKLEWARQEFAAVLSAPPPTPRTDPWRRTSGIHTVRGRRQLAVVRAMWEARDEIARARDTAPGRVLADSAIVAAAVTMPTSPDQLAAVTGFGGRMTRRLVPQMWRAISAALALPDGELPRPSLPGDGPPPVSRWAERDPIAAARLARARAALAGIGERTRVPVENLLSPDTVRRLAWSPPTDASEPGVRAALDAAGARPWQVELTAAALSEALAQPPDD